MLAAAKNDVIRAAFDELKVISAAYEQRRLYESRLKMQQDNWARQDEAEAKGEERGMGKILALWKKGASLEEAEALLGVSH